MRRPGFRKASRTLLALISSVALALTSARAQKPGPAISKDELVRMVKSGMATGDLVKLVRDYGVSFRLTDETAQELRDAGAGAELLGALRALENPPAAATLVITTTPGDADVSVDDQLKGKTTPDGSLEVPALPPGEHRLRVARSGYRSVEQSVRLEAGEKATVAVTLEAEPPTPRVEPPSAPPPNEVALPGRSKALEFQPFVLARSLTAHGGGVNSVVFSPDGRQLASASDDDLVKIWEMATGSEIRSLAGHRDQVHSVAYSPDGRWLASGSRDKTIRLWDAASGREVKTLAGRLGYVYALAFSPDGRRLATASREKTVGIWDVGTGSEDQTLAGHSERVKAVAFSSDGRWLASGGDDMTVLVWDLASGQSRTLGAHTDFVRAVAFSPDGQLLASGSQDGTAKIWQVAAGREVRTLKGHRSWVTSVAFSPDGRWLASGSDDTTVKIWEVSTGREVQTLRGQNANVESVAFSPDGRWLACGSLPHTITLWRQPE